MNQGEVVLCKQLSNPRRIRVLVTRDFIPIENRRQTSNIESNRIERARRLSKRRAQKRELEEK